MNTNLTQSSKEKIFFDTNYIINTIYYICGGKVLYAQLIQLLEEMNLKNVSTAKIKADILQLIKAGFLKKKQVLSSNSNMLILTAYPMSQILSISSRDVPEIATSKKSILESICRIEFLINELRTYRTVKKTNAPIGVNGILAFMQFRNSTVCYPLKNINDYLNELANKYGTLLSDDFYDDYKYLEVVRMQKSNSLSKSDSYIIDPEWIKIKNLHQSLQATMTTEQQNRSLYNINNLKNSSSDIKYLYIEEDGLIHVKINIYDNGNLTLDRIASLSAYFFLMFSKYSIHYEKPIVHVYVQCSCEDIKMELEELAEKKIQTFYGVRNATALTQGLITNGVRIQYLENINIIFNDLKISDNYNIFFD